MGISFNLEGKPPKSGLFKRQATRDAMLHLAVRMDELAEVRTQLYVEEGENPNLYLAGGLIEFYSDDNVVGVGARTSPFGPGFHIYALELALKVGEEMGITWTSKSTDESGYWPKKDQNALYQAMVENNRGIARHVVARPEAANAVNMDAFLTFKHSNFLTPMGPRDSSWFQAVAVGESTGFDIFNWPEPGMGRSFQLGQALYDLWNTIAWINADEAGQQEEYDHVCQLLTKAAASSGDGIPWHAWKELIELGATVDEATRQRVWSEAASHPEPAEKIGYRRKDVTITTESSYKMKVPGWITGQYYGGWEGGTRDIFVGLKALFGPPGALINHAKSLPGEPFDLKLDGAESVFKFHHDVEDGEDVFCIQGIAQDGQEGVLLTITGPPARFEEAAGWARTLVRTGPYYKEVMHS